MNHRTRSKLQCILIYIFFISSIFMLFVIQETALSKDQPSLIASMNGVSALVIDDKNKIHASLNLESAKLIDAMLIEAHQGKAIINNSIISAQKIIISLNKTWDFYDSDILSKNKNCTFEAKSDYLEYDPKKQILKTDKAVKARIGKTHLKMDGIKIYSNNHIVLGYNLSGQLDIEDFCTISFIRK